MSLDNWIEYPGTQVKTYSRKYGGNTAVLERWDRGENVLPDHWLRYKGRSEYIVAHAEEDAIKRAEELVDRIDNPPPTPPKKATTPSRSRR